MKNETKEQTLDRYRKMFSATKPKHKWIRKILREKAESLKKTGGVKNNDRI